jgi:hypothetical protein
MDNKKRIIRHIAFFLFYFLSHHTHIFFLSFCLISFIPPLHCTSIHFCSFYLSLSVSLSSAFGLLAYCYHLAIPFAYLIIRFPQLLSLAFLFFFFFLFFFSEFVLASFQSFSFLFFCFCFFHAHTDGTLLIFEILTRN